MIFDDYFALQKQVHDFFGYQEDWVTIPLVDHREYFWRLDGEGRGNAVEYADTEEFVDESTYSAEIYTQRFLTKWVYRADGYTLICMNPETDGNRWLGIFDNDLERP